MIASLPWLEEAVPYAIPLTERFRGITVREGVLLRGPLGWGEFCPFEEYSDAVAARWLATAVEACTVGWPAPLRPKVPINVTVPAVAPERAYEIVATSGCSTAKVKVADHPSSLGEDQARLEAVRAALGPSGFIRVDANARWDVATAVSSLRHLARAADGLQYAEQPCASLEELAAVRRAVDVPIAADESIRQAADPLSVALTDAADVAVLKCTPLGGVRSALAVAASVGLPCVVSSALETSVGLAAQLALAGALPSLEGACGLGTISLFTGDVVPAASSLRAVGGFLPVPSVAFSSVSVSVSVSGSVSESVGEFALRSPERSAWWLARLERAAALLQDGPGGLAS